MLPPPLDDTPDPRDALIETMERALREINEICGTANPSAFNQIKEAVVGAVGLSDQALADVAAWRESERG